MDGLTLIDRPLVPFLYQLLRAGDIVADRIEEVLEDLERLPPFLPQRYDLPDLASVCAGWATRLEQLANPVISVEAAGEQESVRLKGFALVLVCDERTLRNDRDPLARVYREYEVEGADELAREVQIAAEQAARQMRVAVRRAAAA